jgi:hypothetical protein
MTSPSSILILCAYVQIAVGAFLFVLLAASLYDADAFLTHFLGFPAVGLLGGNSWAQAAVAFGMHAYADVANGLEQVACVRQSKPLPKVVSVWNTTRFFISFIFLLVLARGQVLLHGAMPTAWAPGAQALLVVLLLDATLVRPAAVLCQRALDDARPAPARAEAREWAAFSPLQRFCRGVFYYEAVLSGTSGLAYLLAPELFAWLFKFPAAEAGSAAVLFSLSCFGGLVSAFGLYQMRCAPQAQGAHPFPTLGTLSPPSPPPARLCAAAPSAAPTLTRALAT